MAYGSGGRYEFESPRHIRTVLRAWRVAGLGGHRHRLRLVADPGHAQWQVVYVSDGEPSIDNYDAEEAATTAAQRFIADSGWMWVETSARAHERP